ncbi:MAG: hypothetical protein ACOVN5_00120 [Aquidulcibacter sp.]
MVRAISGKTGLTVHGRSSNLVVLLHASGQDAEHLSDVADAVHECLPDADIWMPPLPIKALLSRSRGAEMTVQIGSAIRDIFNARARRADGLLYEDIRFVGHSYGAALARAVWAQAMGGKADGTANLCDAEPWAARVSRIVLLAAVARGWNQLAPFTTGIRLAAWAGSLIEIMMGDGFAMLDIRRGAPWITTTRLQTLSVLQALNDEGRPAPITVQLLGTIDDIVAPADNVDLATGSYFHYIEVPQTNHLNIVEFGDPAGAIRKSLIITALNGDMVALDAAAVSRRALADMIDEALDDHDIADAEDASIADRRLEPTLPKRDVSVVVFIVHGIRDYGYWTRKFGVRIKQLARTRRLQTRTVTSSYGFFPMGPFLVLSERRKRVGWLRDQYVTAKAMYPKADRFHFVGHSNGTYLLASALKHCRAVRFSNIVFAGSVVRSDFDWGRLLDPRDGYHPQAERVLNYVATSDSVVASVPSAMRAIKSWDLGSAGHHGFFEMEEVRNVKWVPGGHGAALQEQHWNEIAHFTLGGPFPTAEIHDDATDPELKRREPTQNVLVRICGFVAPIMAVAVAAGAVVGISMYAWAGFPGMDWRLFCYCAASIFVFWVATRILTRI